MCQKMIASTFTGTVSFVSACSALNEVVWILSSMTATTLSITGMIMKNPGPLTPCNLPTRNTTYFSQTFATLTDRNTSTAATKNSGASHTLTNSPVANPARSSTNARNKVMGFMMVTS